MHDPAPKGMAHCSHSSIRAPQGPAHFPTVRRTVGTGRDADRPDVLFSSPMAHRVQLSRRLDKRKTPCFPARRLRGAADRIRTCGLSGRSRTIYPAELQPHIYENRRWDEIHRMNFCESLGRNVHGGLFVVRPPRKSARHRIFKRRIAKNQQTMPPRHSCRSRTLYPTELRSLICHIYVTNIV